MKVKEKGDPNLPKIYNVTNIENIEVSHFLEMKIKFLCIPDRITNPDGDLGFIRCLLVEMTENGKDFTDRIALETHTFPKKEYAFHLGVFLRLLGHAITPAKPITPNEPDPV